MLLSYLIIQCNSILGCKFHQVHKAKCTAATRTSRYWVCDWTVAELRNFNFGCLQTDRNIVKRMYFELHFHLCKLIICILFLYQLENHSRIQNRRWGAPQNKKCVRIRRTKTQLEFKTKNRTTLRNTIKNWVDPDVNVAEKQPKCNAQNVKLISVWLQNATASLITIWKTI